VIAKRLNQVGIYTFEQLAELTPEEFEAALDDLLQHFFSLTIQLGDKIRVLFRLNLRAQPGLDSLIILTNGIGTLLEVIGGSVCTFKDTAEGRRAYLWWNIRMEDDRKGWSAEAPLILSYYFLGPIR
jgi:hypothetical protein